MPIECREFKMLYSSCDRVSSQPAYCTPRLQTYLAGRVDNLGRVLLALELDGAREGVFYGWIVRLDKVVFHKLDRER